MNSFSSFKKVLNMSIFKDNNSNEEKKSEIKNIIKENKDEFLKEIEEILINVYSYHIININSRERENNIKICDTNLKKGIEPEIEFRRGKTLITVLSQQLGIYYNAFVQRALSIKIKLLIERKKKNLHLNKNITKLFKLYKSKEKKERDFSYDKYSKKNHIKHNNMRNFSNFNRNIDSINNSLLFLLIELRNFKRSLIESVDDIKNIFNAPLLGFQQLDINKIQLDNYKEVFLNDSFIKYYINKYRNYSNYYIIIKEIEENSFNFGKIIQKQFIFEIPKIIKKNSSSVEKVPSDIDALYNYIVDDSIINNNKKTKKKKKKHKKNIKEEYLEDYLPNDIREEKLLNEKEDFKIHILKNTQNSFICQKQRCNCSKDWLNKLENSLKDCKTFN
jgi:hypothetical protein